MSSELFIVGIGGTTRANSITERVLRAALASAEALGARTETVAGPALPMQPYEPYVEGRSAEAERLVGLVARADGLIIASPSYHGSLSGLLKNTLDHLEDLRDDARPYLHGRAVGCIVVAEGPQSVGSTLAALRAIVHALRGWPTPYAAAVDAKAQPFGGDGPAPAVREALERVAEQVVEFARMRRAYAAPRA